MMTGFCTCYILTLICLVLQGDAFQMTRGCRRVQHNVPSMSLKGKTGFLFDMDQNTYLTSILRKSIDSCNLCLNEGKKLIELEFPANRKNDLSLGETLDTNRAFTRQFINAFDKYGKDLWIIWPDKKVQYKLEYTQAFPIAHTVHHI
jgi:hypothetical protein